MSNCEHACPQPQSEKSILMVTYFAKFQNKKKMKEFRIRNSQTHKNTLYKSNLHTEKKNTFKTLYKQKQNI